MRNFSVFENEKKVAKTATYQFMVDFTLPDTLTQEFMSRIPLQRRIVNQYFKKGKLVSYALSLEGSKIWAIFKVKSEIELMELLAEMPLTPLTKKYQYNALTIFNMPLTEVVDFSIN